ncbi:MAG: FMN-binding protein [Acholeplasmataceae bacterium]|jgi:Na+-translocating ferredoxin:NAD+ oxidoreductase RnfG subunit
MKKQMLKNVIVLALTTILMGALIGVVHFITAPTIKKNRDAKVVEIAKESLTGVATAYRIEDIPAEYKKSEAVELTSKELSALKDYLFSFNEAKEFVGVVATGKSNGYGGEIELAVAINNNDEIVSISEVVFTETTGIGDRALNEYKQKYQNAALNFVPDNVSGATVTSKALKTIIAEVVSKYQENKELFAKVIELKKEPIVIAFGEKVTKTKDETFVASEILLEKYNVTGPTKSGVSYVGAKHHSFEPGYPVSGAIKIEFFIGSDGTILGYEILGYGHSSGRWKPKIISYLDSFVGTKTANIISTMTANKGLYAGATESGEHTVDVILLALEAEVNK